MAAAGLPWFCKICPKRYAGAKKYCEGCEHMLYRKCNALDKPFEGAYTTWYAHHRPHCRECNPELVTNEETEEESKKKAKLRHLHDRSDGALALMFVLPLLLHKLLSSIEGYVCVSGAAQCHPWYSFGWSTRSCWPTRSA